MVCELAEVAPPRCLGVLVNAADVLDRWFRHPTNMGRGARARDLLFLLSALNQVSGSTAGSSMRLPLPNSTFGRSWCLLSRALLTRLSCTLVLAQLPALCCMNLQQNLSSNWHRICSGRLCWRGCDCPSKCPRPIVNAGHFGSSHFGSRLKCCVSFAFLLHFCKTFYFHGSQGGAPLRCRAGGCR